MESQMKLMIEQRKTDLWHEIDLAARYALIDLRERCLYHRRGLGQVGRYLFCTHEGNQDGSV